eukprot:jgi/Hompol1/2306/HPOL_002891-RA
MALMQATKDANPKSGESLGDKRSERSIIVNPAFFPTPALTVSTSQTGFQASSAAQNAAPPLPLSSIPSKTAALKPPPVITAPQKATVDNKVMQLESEIDRLRQSIENRQKEKAAAAAAATSATTALSASSSQPMLLAAEDSSGCSSDLTPMVVEVKLNTEQEPLLENKQSTVEPTIKPKDAAPVHVADPHSDLKLLEAVTQSIKAAEELADMLHIKIKSTKHAIVSVGQVRKVLASQSTQADAELRHIDLDIERLVARRKAVEDRIKSLNSRDARQTVLLSSSQRTLESLTNQEATVRQQIANDLKKMRDIQQRIATSGIHPSASKDKQVETVSSDFMPLTQETSPQQATSASLSTDIDLAECPADTQVTTVAPDIGELLISQDLAGDQLQGERSAASSPTRDLASGMPSQADALTSIDPTKFCDDEPTVYPLLSLGSDTVLQHPLDLSLPSAVVAHRADLVVNLFNGWHRPLSFPNNLAAEDSRSSAKSRFVPYSAVLPQFQGLYASIPGTDFEKLKLHSVSKRFDPLLPLCKYEAEGGKCSDSTCQGQHLVSISTTDDEVLSSVLSTCAVALNAADLERLVADMQKKRATGASLEAVTLVALETLQRQDAIALNRRIFKGTRVALNKPSTITVAEGSMQSGGTLTGEIRDEEAIYHPVLPPSPPVLCNGITKLINGTRTAESRYYEPALSIEEYETDVKHDPHKIEMWIGYALHHLSPKSDGNVAKGLRSSAKLHSALQVLSSGVQANRTSEHLWLLYLELYQRRGRRQDTRELFKNATRFVPGCIIFWWQWYLFEYAEPGEASINVLVSMLKHLCSDTSSSIDSSRRSSAILCCVVQLVHLHQLQGNPHRAMETLSSVFDGTIVEKMALSASPLDLIEFSHVCQLTIISIYIALLGTLPDSMFYAYPHHYLVKSQPFVINFSHPQCSTSQESALLIHDIVLTWRERSIDAIDSAAPSTLSSPQRDPWFIAVLRSLRNSRHDLLQNLDLAWLVAQACADDAQSPSRKILSDIQFGSASTIVDKQCEEHTIALFKHALGIELLDLRDSINTTGSLEFAEHVHRNALESNVHLWLNYLLFLAISENAATIANASSFAHIGAAPAILDRALET